MACVPSPKERPIKRLSPRVDDFCSHYKGRENFIMDTLFKGLDGACLRYEHGGLIFCLGEETHEGKGQLLVSLKSNKLYVGH